MRERFDAAAVSGKIIDTLRSFGPIDFRANNPAVVTISGSDLWAQPQPAALAEVELLRHLRPASPDPRALLAAYRRASGYATVHGSVLSGTATRNAMSEVMAIPSRSPIRKVHALQDLISMLPALRAQFGGETGFAAVSEMCDEYVRCLSLGRRWSMTQMLCSHDVGPFGTSTGRSYPRRVISTASKPSAMPTEASGSSSSATGRA